MEKLGVEPFQLLTQLFNFFLMVFILTKFLYKPITKKLEERKKKIEEGLEYADRMKSEMEKSDKKRQDVIDRAKLDAKKIVEEAKKEGRKLEAEIVEKAHKEARSILEKGQSELTMERQEMEKSLRKQTVDIASNMVETVLGEVISTKDHIKIINKRIGALKRNYKYKS